jgi:diguanylate cyclase (GGDEF)-like protein
VPTDIQTALADPVAELAAHWTAEPFDAAAALATVARIEKNAPTEAERAWCEFLRAFCTLRTGDNDAAAKHIEQSLAHAQVAPEPRVGLLGRYLRAFRQSLQGEHADALGEFDSILADRSGALTDFDRAVVSGNFGTCLWMAGSLQEAARRLFDCVETMRAEDRPHRAMVAMINLGQLLTDLGDLTSAWEVYQDLVRMPEAQQMSRTRLAMPIMGLGIHLARRDYKAAYLALPAVEEVIAAQPLVESEAQVPAAMAEAYLRHGDIDRAREWLEHGEAIAQMPRQQRAHARLQQVSALLHLHDGEAAAALACASQAAQILEQENYLVGWCEALETLAECQQACGEWQQATATLKRYNEVTRTLASNANTSRHYLLEAQFKFARMREERDRIGAQNELLARHAEELTGINRKLEVNLAEVDALRRELAEQAVRDTLTGLYNRRRLETAWPESLARAEAQGVELFVALIDVDHFKRINDTWGHGTGDEVLRTMAGVLARSFRPDDLLIRYGGEEFCVICMAAGIEPLHERLSRALDMLRKSEIRDTTPLLSGIGFSAGMTAAIAGEAFESVASRADAALYRAKAAGRGRILAG